MKAPQRRLLGIGSSVAIFTLALACGSKSSPAAPTTTPPVTTTPKLDAPVAQAPTGGQRLTENTVTLKVTNAKVTGTVGTVKYRFEWSELDSFPDNTRTGSKDDVEQGADTTSYTITATLAPDQKLYWRARATGGTVLPSEWSSTESFITNNQGFISGQSIWDPLTNGTTVGTKIGGHFEAGKGWKADSLTDGIDYTVRPSCGSCTLEFDVTNFGKGEGAPYNADVKWISMGDGPTFGDFFAFRDHPWKMHLEQRADNDGSGMKLIWRNGATGGGEPGDHTGKVDPAINWQSNVVYHFKLTWNPNGFQVIINGTTWFTDGFSGHAYTPPTHVISLGTRARSETMIGCIWSNVRLTPN